MRHYETVVILRPDLSDEQISDSLDWLSRLLREQKAEVLTVDSWGIRELAYPIKRERRGYYARLDYLAEPSAVAELDRQLKLAETVLRHMSILVERRPKVEALRKQAQARAAETSPAPSSEQSGMEAASQQSPSDAGPEPTAEVGEFERKE